MPTYRKNIQKLSTIIKNTEFSELISGQSASKFEYLTFDEILDFMYELATKGVKSQNNLIKIEFEDHFFAYLKAVK